MENDIAMITLNRKIDFFIDSISDKMSCVCDPEPHDRLDLTKCKAMGWGQTHPRIRESASSVLLAIDYPGKFNN